MTESNAFGGGFWGRVLEVDLTSGRIDYRAIAPAVYRRFLGGLGLAAHWLWDHLTPGCDPLGPDNILGFTPGLLTEAGTVFTGRFNVVAKSPVTGGWTDANCGGYFAPALKRCGIDGLFITGRAEKPVYLLIEDDSAEIRDAAELWGLDTYQTEDRLKAEHGRRTQSAVIGPAGEKQSLIAGIATDHGRLAARNGLGAVMGAKNLKAVACLGRSKVGRAEPERIKELTRAFRDNLTGGKFMRRIIGDRLARIIGFITRTGPVQTRQPADVYRWLLDKYGTSGITIMSAESGDSPVKNWAGVGYRDFPAARSVKIGGQAIEAYKTKGYGCSSCPIRCGAWLEVPDGPYPLERTHRPEYETLCAFGALVLNDDLASILKVNDLLNRAGMDTISAGGAVAMAIECYENGLLTKDDTGGLELRWGASGAIVELVEMIIDRRSLGELLADGVRPAAERIGRGSERYAVHCGGVEPPMHDPKFDLGYAITYHCEPSPSRHEVSAFQLLDLAQLEKQFSFIPRTPALTTRQARFDPKGKAGPIAQGSYFRQLVDSLGCCIFGVHVGGRLPLLEWVNAVTGWDMTDREMFKVGERVQQLRHAFNLREGVDARRDFKPHPRLYGSPPLDKGPAKGLTIDQDRLAEDYYRANGWDPATGRPDPDRLRELGLDEAAEYFETGG